MGNRAVITNSTTDDAPSIYVHWNGGMDSIQGFMGAAIALHITGSETERMDALGHILAKHFFGTESNGLNVYRENFGDTDQDNCDNGVYIINDDWEIIGRKFNRNGEQQHWSPADITTQILDNVVREISPSYKPEP